MRDQKIPYLGICFGFQLAIVAFVRNVCMLEDANSTELDPDTEHPVVKYMPEQNKKKEMGVSMRLGEHEIEIIEGVMLEDFMEVESFTEGIDIDSI